jgi:putative hydrolase of the HAD superfamily
VIEACIFDWGGTLAPWLIVDELAGWRAYAQVLHPDDPVASARVAGALQRAQDDRWSAVRTSSRAFRLEHVIADATAALTSEGWAEVPWSEPALTAYRETWLEVSHTRPEAAAMLTELRSRGLALGVLSSTAWPATWHEEWLARDGVLEFFDACVWSSDLTWTKPHPDAFAAVMSALGVSDPARCVYVGDRRYDDVHGAAGVGMRTVFIPHSSPPPEQLVPTDVEPDVVLDSLTDLPAVLERW